jgi:uncharacterized protein (DUF2252 family)
VRMLSSVLVAAEMLRASHREALELCESFVSAYADALADGKAAWIERDTTEGLVKQLLDTLKSRKRVDHLHQRTELKKGRRTLRLDGKKALPVDQADRAKATAMVEEFAKQQPNRDFFEVLDVARRIAGNGSLGVERYVILVEGKGSPDANYLLDLKKATPSSLAPHLKKVSQPAWVSQAHRVVELQSRMQAMPMAFLHPIAHRGKASYVLRGLQPSEDRVSLDAKHNTLAQIDVVLREMGRIVAWAQLRSAGRQGSAIADELIDFGASRRKWQPDLLDAAEHAEEQVMQDWKTYRKAYEDGELKL